MYWWEGDDSTDDRGGTSKRHSGGGQVNWRQFSQGKGQVKRYLVSIYLFIAHLRGGCLL